MRAISKGRSIWTKTSENINIDHNLCIECRICEKSCPVNAIQLTCKYVEIQYDKCIACMRCVNYCPKNAFTLGGKRIIQKRLLR